MSRETWALSEWSQSIKAMRRRGRSGYRFICNSHEEKDTRRGNQGKKAKGSEKIAKALEVLHAGDICKIHAPS